MLAELGAFTLLHEYERSDFISCLRPWWEHAPPRWSLFKGQSSLTRLAPSLLSSLASEQGKM